MLEALVGEPRAKKVRPNGADFAMDGAVTNKVSRRDVGVGGRLESERT